MKQSEKQLAYVKRRDDIVTIELISLGKNGCGFHLNNEFFKRSMRHDLPFRHDMGAVDSNNNEVRMSLLSRPAPRWIDNGAIEVALEAQPHYRSWVLCNK
ncbi:hypothetical protein AB6D11_00945 [Vibrio splendidus]